MSNQDGTAPIRYIHVNALDGRATSGTVGHHMALDKLVGPEGKARIRLDRHHGMAGWVNDCGHLAPDKYPRNVVGSCLLACLGAGRQPYAGNVLITGWDHAATMRDEIEVVALDEAKAHELSEIVAAIRQILGYDPDDPQGFDIAPSWANAIEDFAAFVTAAPAPHLTVINEPAEVLTVLRQMAGGGA